MYEVEVKVRAAHDDVRDRLAALGAESAGRVVQTDVYYDAPHRNFAETDEALRVRRESGEGADVAELTYKGPLVDDRSKTRREVETCVGDADEAGTILAALDFEPAATVTKERERYAVRDSTVTLDAVEGLGEFVEIENESDRDGVDAAREDAHELCRALDLDPAEGIRTSYLGLLLDADE